MLTGGVNDYLTEFDSIEKLATWMNDDPHAAVEELWELRESYFKLQEVAKRMGAENASLQAQLLAHGIQPE